MSNISIASMNCRGLGDTQKKRDVFHYLRQRQHSIYFLQDTHFDPKLDKYITAEWGFTSYFSSYNTKSRGVAILFNNNFEFKVKGVHRDGSGNYLMVHINTMKLDILLINLYGPNRDDPHFYVTLNNKINQLKIPNLIIAGDWNLVLDPVKDYDNYKKTDHNVKAREKVDELIEDYCLVDIWRELNPEMRRFTWRRVNPLQQSRLDFFLMSENICNHTVDAEIQPGYRTDHSLITLNMNFGDNCKKKSFWKLNSSLLKDYNYVTEINGLIEKIIEQYAILPYNRENLSTLSTKDIQYVISDQLFLEVLLMEIRSKTISYATMKKKKMLQQEVQLENDIRCIENKTTKNENDLDELKEKNDTLVKIRQLKMEGVLLRSRARWVSDGEKVTKYFCGLEKRNYVSKQMTKLVKTNGVTVTETKDIIEETKQFYSSLYEKKQTEECAIHNIVQEIPSLSEIEANKLEGTIEVQEATYVLKKMKNGKSPGSDGFTVEFFKVFWTKRLNHIVVRAINDGFQKGEMSSTQKEGIITCIPKGDKPREFLKNWRPISLLNVVYKIATACIAARIKSVLHSIISEDQSGFMAGRYIGSNIRLIYDLINYCNDNNVSGLLFCIDFEKAFDSLDWNFMYKTLAAFGFKNDILRWIKTFYTNIKSTVIVNGQPCSWFGVERGCRQGDPISPYLFIICAEILSIMIRKNDNIKGITIGNTEHKLSQFADDTELFQNGDKETFEETIRVLSDFGNKSGLKPNVEKTIAVWLGKEQNSQVRYMPHLNFEWNPPTFKILGVWFTGDLKNCIQLNFDAKFQEVKALFLVWLKRLITPLGRIAVLKSLVLSKLVHLWLLLPDPPDNFVKNLQKMIFQFIWNRKRDRISRISAVKAIRDGGLGVTDVKCYIESLKLTWINKLKNSNHKWKTIIVHQCPDIENIDLYGPSIFVKRPIPNAFWKNVFTVYESFRYQIIPKSQEAVLAEHLFYNNNIKIGKQSIFLQNWVENNVFCIGHLIKENGNFLTYNEFCEKYQIRTNFLTFFGIVKSIQKYCCKLDIEIANNKMLKKAKSLSIIDAQMKGAKGFYNILIHREEKSNCCSKWEERLGEEINWESCFLKISKIPDIKLKWFQTRVTHRIIATNIVLKEMGITQTTFCDFCKRERDSIQHCFWRCAIVNRFWKDLAELLNTTCLNVHNLKFCETFILFGVEGNVASNETLDFLVLFAKYFIYKCKYGKIKPTIIRFRKQLKERYKIEEYNSKINLTFSEFRANWASFDSLING